MLTSFQITYRSWMAKFFIGLGPYPEFAERTKDGQIDACCLLYGRLWKDVRRGYTAKFFQRKYSAPLSDR
jgi:hypothetical protein